MRDAHVVELDEVGTVTVEAYAEFRERFGEDVWAQYSSDLRDAHARAAAGIVLVAVADCGIVGTAALLPTDDPSEVMMRMVAVRNDARRLGAGRALVEACIERARAIGASTLRWHTISFFDAAIDLYRRMGFEPLGPADNGLLTYRLRIIGYRESRIRPGRDNS